MKRLRRLFKRLRTAWRMLTCEHHFTVFYDKDATPADMARSTSVYAAGAYLKGQCQDGDFGDKEAASARMWMIIRALTLQDDLLLYWHDHTDGQYYAAWACESDERLQELLSLTVDTDTQESTL